MLINNNRAQALPNVPGPVPVINVPIEEINNDRAQALLDATIPARAPEALLLDNRDNYHQAQAPNQYQQVAIAGGLPVPVPVPNLPAVIEQYNNNNNRAQAHEGVININLQGVRVPVPIPVPNLPVVNDQPNENNNRAQAHQIAADPDPGGGGQ
jgi:hypothetical protein